MELKEFLKSAISDIIDSVSELQDENKTNAVINPIGVRSGDCALDPERIGEKCRVVDVRFNINLCENQNSKGENGIGVMFNGIGIGHKSIDNVGSASSTSMSFSIPIILPRKD